MYLYGRLLTSSNQDQIRFIIKLFINLIYLITLIFLSEIAKGQCEDKIGYDKDGSLASAKILKGFNSNSDTSIKIAIWINVVKTQMTNGLFLKALVERTIGTIDGQTELKLTFQDGTNIIVSKYIKEENSIGLFDAVITDKYRLLLLKTKPIIKVQITGPQLDAHTYLIEGINSIDFMLTLDCLEQYL